MKTGDLVEFKDGLFGINAPLNKGLYLERHKKGKHYFVVLWTTKGRKEVKKDHVKGVVLHANLDATDDATLRNRLDQLLAKAKEKPANENVDISEASDRDLWRFTNALEPPLTTTDIANAYLKSTASPKQVDQVRNVLQTCAREGVGYFNRTEGRGERWVPLPGPAHKEVRQEIEGFHHLRNKLVATEEVEDEDGRVHTLYVGVPADAWDLDEEDERRLGVLERLMVDFILEDRFEGRVGIPTTADFLVHTIDGFRLFDHAKWLALDWTDARGVSISSAFVQFLVDTGRLSVEEAIDLVARRRIKGEAFFDYEVPRDAEREAERLAVDADEVARRVDLRNLVAWTIDPADAKDHDDAVSYAVHDDGSFDVWVHIADVAHFVEPGTTLDHHARRRATSVYLPTGVLPMLPPRLSDDLCSLNTGEDKLAMTVRLRYDADGGFQEGEAMESVIRVDENASYEEALAGIEAGAGPFAELNDLTKRIQSHRRGLDLETSEVRVRIGTDEARAAGGVSHAVKKGNAATKMIETLMVEANEFVARTLRDAGVPALYRCHPLPDRVSVDRFNAQARTMEVPVAIELPDREEAGDDDGDTGGASVLDLLKGGKMELSGAGLTSALAADDEDDDDEDEGVQHAPMMKGLAQLSPEEQDAWLTPFREGLAKVGAIDDEELRELVYIKSLSCMGRALYTPGNIGHFGLGSTCYAHFTSPIRRYADVTIHRQLKWLLRGGADAGEATPHGDDLADLADHVSEQTGRAEQAERDVVGSVLVFLSRGTTWEGTVKGLVNGVTKGGLFLSLPDGLESRISTSDIPGGPWDVDDNDSLLFREAEPTDIDASNWKELYHEDLGMEVFVRARLGDRVPVVLGQRDYVEGRIRAGLAG